MAGHGGSRTRRWWVSIRDQGRIMRAPSKAVAVAALSARFEGASDGTEGGRAPPGSGYRSQGCGTLASRARGRRRGDGGCSISPSGAAAFSVAKSMPAEGRRRVLSLAPFSFKVGLAPRPDRESTLAYIATDATAKDGEGRVAVGTPLLLLLLCAREGSVFCVSLRRPRAALLRSR